MNICSPIDVTESGIVSSVMPVQFWNAAPPMLSSPSFSFNSFNALQSLKARSLIAFNDEGRLMLSRASQPLNALYSREVIPVPLRSISLTVSMPEKAKSGITSPPVTVIFSMA